MKKVAIDSNKFRECLREKYGSVASACERLGRSPGYFNRAIQRGELETHKLIQVVDMLGIPKNKFVSQRIVPIDYDTEASETKIDKKMITDVVKFATKSGIKLYFNDEREGFRKLIASIVREEIEKAFS